MRNFFRYAKNRFLYNLLRILIIVSIGFIIGSCEVKADEITSFDFMDKGNNSFIIGANSYVSGDFSIMVEDITQIKPYVNLLVAMTGYPDFIITENDYFSNTVIKKLYSSGTTNINGYTADLYVIQFATRGTGWNCSVSGLNCYISTQLRLNNTYGYNAIYQLQSISLTDSVLTDDYLANMQINQNNQIIEQGKETNEKLDNLDETIQSGNQAIQDSITESNKETQEVIKDQFNSCRDSINLFDLTQYPFVLRVAYTSSGSLAWWGGYVGIQEYFPVEENKIYTFSSSLNKALARVVFYDIDKNIISSDIATTFTFTTPSETKYIRFTVNKEELPTWVQLQEGSVTTDHEPYGEKICTNKLDEQNETSKGIWATIKDLPNQFLNMLKGLIIPDNFDFIYEFQDALESKLGFIASIPLQFIEFLLNLATASWVEVTSITLPEIEMFGVKWWNGTEIDISEGLKMFEAIKYFTDILCVILMVNTLHKWYESFTGGGE